MRSILSTTLLVPFTIILGVLLFWFRPGGVDGPRPEPVPVEGRGFDHSAWTAVLAQVVDDQGMVDYAKLSADTEPLNHYLGQLRLTSPKSAPHRFKTNEDRLAYYINAYNAFTMAAVRDHCPISDVNAEYIGGGFFWRISFLMGEERVTLSQIEGDFIRGIGGREPAVHLALVKGAKGFPRLEQTAFDGATLKPRLKALAKRVANDRRFASREGNVIKVSELFKWYQVDFGSNIAHWLSEQAPGFDDTSLTLEFLPFDWSLNGRCPD